MPPKTRQEPKRRSRKESLKDDLFRLLNEQEKSDEIFYAVLKEAIEEGVFEDLKLHQKRMIFSHFAADAMMKCFEEMYYVFVTNFRSLEICVFLHTVCSSTGSDEDALKMTRLLLVPIRQIETVDEESCWHHAIAATVQYSRLPIARAMLAKWKEICAPQQKSDQDGKIINTLATALLKEGVYNASVEAVRLALQSSCEIEASLTVKAATLTDSTILEMLLGAGADIVSKNAAGETPLLAAVRSGSLANVKFLIRTHHISIRLFCHLYTAVLMAIENRRAKILKELMDADGYVDVFSCSRACVAHDEFDCFKILLSEINIQPNVLNEVLSCVVTHRKYEMLSFALFECLNTPEVMKINDFERLLKKATNDEIRKLIQQKIDIMNGKGDVKVKVKEEQV